MAHRDPLLQSNEIARRIQTRAFDKAKLCRQRPSFGRWQSHPQGRQPFTPGGVIILRPHGGHTDQRDAMTQSLLGIELQRGLAPTIGCVGQGQGGNDLLLTGLGNPGPGERW